MNNVVTPSQWCAQPIWPCPPQPCPPQVCCDCGPVPCLPPTCPPQPCCGSGSNLIDCWNQITQLKSIIQQIMNDMGGPIQTGPIQGVVDGSSAKPGDVGEFMTGSGNFTVTGAAGSFSANVSPIVIPPGDWDIRALATDSTGVTNFAFNLDPIPAGMSNQLYANSGIGSATFADLFGALIAIGRGNFAVPTLLPFKVAYYNQAAGTPGAITLTVEARRMR